MIENDILIANFKQKCITSQTFKNGRNTYRNVSLDKKLLFAQGLGFNGILWPLSIAKLKTESGKIS